MMAALDLHCGIDPGVCVWSGDLFDSFDSEVQLWEEQLQEVQRKIEEVRQTSLNNRLEKLNEISS